MDLPALQSSWYLLFLIAIPLSLLVVHSHSSRKPISTGLKPHPLLGNFLEYLRNRGRFLEWVTETLVANPTHTMGLHIPCLASGIITANPANVEHILKTRAENYPKGWRNTFTMEDFMGRGIFNSDGEQWRAQRKTASYEFNKRSLRNFVVDTVRGEVVRRLLPLLETAGDRGEVVDLQCVLERFAFDNICRVAFDVDPGCLGVEGGGAAEKAEGKVVPAGFMEAFDAAAAISFDRFIYAFPFAWRVKKLLNVGTERRLRESISTVHGFAEEIVRSRKAADPLRQKDDLLSRFAASGDYTDEFLRDVVVNFMIAGRETTSSALTWFFWLLSRRPHVEKKILEEIASVRAARATEDTSAETFGFEELREMHYLHAAISESLRLYPPVVLDGQECVEDDVLPDGTFVGRGWFTMYSAYAMGRVADVWGEDCGEYRPERWLDAGGAFQPESPFRFPVFHGGPRTCLGKEMAYIQMKSIAACVLERFAVDVVDKEKGGEQVLSLTLRMKGGLPVGVRKREGVVVSR